MDFPIYALSLSLSKFCFTQFVKRRKMVSKAEEGMKKRKQEQQQVRQIQLNKGKSIKFKRSTFNLDEDGASSAILLLAYIAFTPNSNM